MNAQEIFDTVVNHLAKQKTRSVASMSINQCAYRGVNGKMCAVGCLIPDEDYKPEMEGNTVDQLRDFDMLPSALHSHVSLLHDLQHAHDYSDDLNDLKEALVSVCNKYDLNMFAIGNMTEWYKHS